MKIKDKLKRSVKGLFGALVLSGLLLGNPLAATAVNPVEMNTEEGWTLIAEKGDVKVYAQIVTCGSDEQSMYLVKLVNANESEDLTVECTINVSNSTTEGVRTVSTKLARNSSMEGSCDNMQSPLQAYMVNPEDGFKPLEIIIRTIKTTDHEK